jgi:hypothetical protein
MPVQARRVIGMLRGRTSSPCSRHSAAMASARPRPGSTSAAFAGVRIGRRSSNTWNPAGVAGSTETSP